MDHRKESQQLAAELYRARNNPDAQLLLKLLEAEYERAKEAMVAALPADVALVQQEARAYKRLRDLITRQPLSERSEK